MNLCPPTELVCCSFFTRAFGECVVRSGCVGCRVMFTYKLAFCVGERIFSEDIILRSVVKSERMLTFEFLGTSKGIQRILFALRRKIWATRVGFLTYSLTMLEILSFDI